MLSNIHFNNQYEPGESVDTVVQFVIAYICQDTVNAKIRQDLSDYGISVWNTLDSDDSILRYPYIITNVAGVTHTNNAGKLFWKQVSIQVGLKMGAEFTISTQAISTLLSSLGRWSLVYMFVCPNPEPAAMLESTISHNKLFSDIITGNIIPSDLIQLQVYIMLPNVYRIIEDELRAHGCVCVSNLYPTQLSSHLDYGHWLSYSMGINAYMKEGKLWFEVK